MRETPSYLLLGEILRPHGVRGEVRVKLFTAYPERIDDLETVYLGKSADTPDPVAYTIGGMRMNSGYGLLKLQGIDDRDEAGRLRGLYIMIDLEHAVPLEEGEFYLYQLIGMTVQLEDGVVFGTLREVLETGANDVYIVDSPAHGEVLIPATQETILNTDPTLGIVTVRLPHGLLPEDVAEDA